MAEKRVSVRLAAVGGKQVKAEFEGIGEAGKRGFGKASREMEIANVRLARFARRAKIAAGTMAIDKRSSSIGRLGRDLARYRGFESGRGVVSSAQRLK